MLKFDVTKMRSRYFYITKITSAYVYVVSTRSGAPLSENNYKKTEFRDREVSLFPISDAVYKSYCQYNLITEFYEPVLASINYYGDEVVSIEIQRKNYFTGKTQSEKNWTSIYTRSISKVTECCKHFDNVFINGQHIMFTEPHANAPENFLRVSSSPASLGGKSPMGKSYFSLEPCMIASLGHLGFDIEALKENNKEEEKNAVEKSLETGDKKPTLVNESLLDLTPTMMLTLDVNASTDDPTHKVNILPVSGEAQKTLLDLLDTPVNGYMFIKAVSLISELYGQSAAEYAQIEKLIAISGTPCPASLSELTLRRLATHMSGREAIFWLTGHLYRAETINEVQKITTTISNVIHKGRSLSLNADEIYQNGQAGKIPEHTPYIPQKKLAV